MKGMTAAEMVEELKTNPRSIRVATYSLRRAKFIEPFKSPKEPILATRDGVRVYRIYTAGKK